MEDHDKTKEQLINELHEIRQKVTKLEACCTPLFDGSFPAKKGIGIRD
jgi:hypothetical protein